MVKVTIPQIAMPLSCPRCGREFAYPCYLKRHEQRKEPCARAPAVAAPAKEHPCKYCGRTYRHQSGVSRHQKTCKSRPELVDKSVVSELRGEVAEMQEQLKTMMLRETRGGGDAAPAPPAAAAAPVAVADNSVAVHGDLVQNKQVNTTVNLTINNFGEEDEVLEFAKKVGEMLDKLPPMSGKAVISAGVEAIWNSLGRPNNWTAVMTNKKDGTIQVKTENGWEKRSKEEVIPLMISRACDNLAGKQEPLSALDPRWDRRGKRIREGFNEELRMREEGTLVKEGMQLLAPLLQSVASRLRKGSRGALATEVPEPPGGLPGAPPPAPLVPMPPAAAPGE